MVLCLPDKLSLWIGFILSLLCTLGTGLNMSFNTYALSVKETFNYTQTQVELIASMGTIGLASTSLEPLCTWLFGFKVTALIIAIGVPAFSGLFSLAAYYNTFFHYWPSLVCVIQLVQAALNAIAYIAISRVCIELFPKRYTGKLVGIYLATGSCGCFVFAGLIDSVFQADLSGFFLFYTLMTGALYGTCLVFLFPFANSKEEHRDLKLWEPDDSDGEVDEVMNATTKDMLQSPFFHILFWSSAIYYGCCCTCVNNITSMAESAGMADPLEPVYVLSGAVLVVRIGFGVIYDTFRSLACGYILLFISYTAFVAGLLMFMLFVGDLSVFIATAVTGIGTASGMGTPVSMLLTRFGRQHYSAIAGVFYTVAGTSQIVLQLLAGFLYDLELEKLGLTGTICYGLGCFYWPICLMLTITILICTLQLVYALITLLCKSLVS